MILDDDDDEPKSLVDRVGGSPGLPLKKEAKPKKPRAPKKEKEAGSPKKNGTPKKKGKGGKKKNPWSDSEEDDNEPDFSDDDVSINGDVVSSIPRNTAQRRAASKCICLYRVATGQGILRKVWEI